MTALSTLLDKAKGPAMEEPELDIASLGQTVATADSLKRAKEARRSTKKGGKKSGESASCLGASLSDLIESFHNSQGSFGSDPEEMTMATQDSREHSSSSSLTKRTKRGGRRKEKYCDDEKAQHRSRTIQLEPDE